MFIIYLVTLFCFKPLASSTYLQPNKKEPKSQNPNKLLSGEGKIYNYKFKVYSDPPFIVKHLA